MNYANGGAQRFYEQFRTNRCGPPSTVHSAEGIDYFYAGICTLVGRLTLPHPV